MIHTERVRDLNDAPIRRGSYVLYWMQAAQRARYNHALEYAVRMANEVGLPVVCLFVLTENYPEANLRHYTFMAEGLVETAEWMRERDILFVLRYGDPLEEVVRTAKDASLVVTDRGYLRIQKLWRRGIADLAPCRVVEVEAEVVVPVEAAYEKEAFSAAAVRPRINRLTFYYLRPLTETVPLCKSHRLSIEGFKVPLTPRGVLSRATIDTTVGPVAAFRGGTSKAMARLDDFIAERAHSYDVARMDPSLFATSGLSPYLHFGQISPLYVALMIREDARIPAAAKEVFLEELIVRRELAVNFTHYREDYDDYEALPPWARTTLDRHVSDRRPYLYNDEELEKALTHDPYWNAAQRELLNTGSMHPYMRMYWGKKIIEWSPSPKEAFRRALYLNNRYALDGRDPNSFAGVAWCFGKHDRPWPERPVFGKVRYMTAEGLRRKFNMDIYVERFNARC